MMTKLQLWSVVIIMLAVIMAGGSSVFAQEEKSSLSDQGSMATMPSSTVPAEVLSDEDKHILGLSPEDEMSVGEEQLAEDIDEIQQIVGEIQNIFSGDQPQKSEGK